MNMRQRNHMSPDRRQGGHTQVHLGELPILTQKFSWEDQTLIPCDLSHKFKLVSIVYCSWRKSVLPNKKQTDHRPNQTVPETSRPMCPLKRHEAGAPNEKIFSKILEISFSAFFLDCFRAS